MRATNFSTEFLPVEAVFSSGFLFDTSWEALALALGLCLGISLVEMGFVTWGYREALTPGDTFEDKACDWAEGYAI